MAVIYFAYLFLVRRPRPATRRSGSPSILVLFIFAAIFWAAFEQAPTSLNLFARDFTDRTLFGWRDADDLVPVGQLAVRDHLRPDLGRALGRPREARPRPLEPRQVRDRARLRRGRASCSWWRPSNRVIAGGTVVRVSMLWLIASYFFQTHRRARAQPRGPQLDDQARSAPVRRSDDGHLVHLHRARQPHRRHRGRQRGPREAHQMPILFQRTAMSLFVAALVLAALVIPIRKMMRRR